MNERWRKSGDESAKAMQLILLVTDDALLPYDLDVCQELLDAINHLMLSYTCQGTMTRSPARQHRIDCNREDNEINIST